MSTENLQAELNCLRAENASRKEKRNSAVYLKVKQYSYQIQQLAVPPLNRQIAYPIIGRK